MFAAANGTDAVWDDGQLVKCQIKISLTSTGKDDFDQVCLLSSLVVHKEAHLSLSKYTHTRALLFLL